MARWVLIVSREPVGILVRFCLSVSYKLRDFAFSVLNPVASTQFYPRMLSKALFCSVGLDVVVSTVFRIYTVPASAEACVRLGGSVQRCIRCAVLQPAILHRVRARGPTIACAISCRIVSSISALDAFKQNVTESVICFSLYAGRCRHARVRDQNQISIRAQGHFYVHGPVAIDCPRYQSQKGSSRGVKSVL